MFLKLFWIFFIIVDGVDIIFDERLVCFVEFFDKIVEGVFVVKIVWLKDFI